MIYYKINNLKTVIRYTWLLLFMFIVNLQNIDAQILNDIEKRYETLKSNLVKEQFILDTLTQSLEKIAALINEEKSKSKPNQDKIYKLMARSVIISNSIKSQQEKILQIEKSLEEARQKLDYHYSIMIDSLKSLKQTALKKADERSIDNQILTIIEKRLLITPRIKQLSFLPEKILAIDLNKTKDTLQRNIYKEYLTAALNEVNSLLEQVNETSSEIAQILALQAKASKFLDEVEFETRIKPFGTSSTRSTSTDAYNSSRDIKGLEYSSQLQSFISLRNQLNFRHSTYNQMTDEKFLNFGKDPVSLKDYHELLKDLKKRLNDYKAIISDKLNIR